MRGANVVRRPTLEVGADQGRSRAHPGFTATDAQGVVWFLEFDPRPFPEGATAAVAIATKIFWALGYNQVESFLTTFDPKKASIDPKATLRRPSGKRTRFGQDDVNAILENVARSPDGTYRVIAGRLLPGKILGPFQYAGTRPDDPNDLVPHQHRRELRALRVFGAWTNLTDLKAQITIDTLVTENGKPIVKHYLQDVGSTFGMQRFPRVGSELQYFLAPPSRKRLLSLVRAQPVADRRLRRYPSVGKFEGGIRSGRWRPGGDGTWSCATTTRSGGTARRGFTDDMIRAVVHTVQFSNPEAEKYLADVLIQRRETIKRIYLTHLNPIVDPRLDGKQLTFENPAVAGGVVRGNVAYRASWMRFDNATGATTPLTETTSATTTIAAPSGLPSSGYVAVDIAADSDGHPTWKQPVRAYFRRDSGNWTLAGLDRLPEKLPVGTAPKQPS